MEKANYICAFCNKAFTRNGSLKRHKQNVHFKPSFKCLTCPKTYRRHEDLSKHGKECLTKALNNSDEKSMDRIQKPSTSKDNGTIDLTRDLALSSDSETSISESIMANHIEKQLFCNQTRSIEVNTEQSRVHSKDKSTQTEPLIILTPDEITQFRDGLTIATFTNNIQVFVDTLNSQILMSRPNLSTPPEPSTQVGLLKIQSSASRSVQTKHTDSQSQDEFPMCQRIPTRPSLVVPEWRKAKLRLPGNPSTSKE